MLGLGFSLTKAATVLASGGEGGQAPMTASNLLSVRANTDTAIDSFEAWLGNAPGAVMAFCDGDTWANIKARPASIASDYTGHPNIRKDWAIPLASNTQNVAATLAGTHDADITDLAEAVLANDSSSQIWIRLGWEMNLTSYPWASGNATAADYILAFQRVVGLFRAVSDKFRFGWIPNWGGTANPEDWYPGDDYVDYVGMNMYFKTEFDQNTGQTGPEVWTNKRSGATYSLDYIASFADSHNKRLAIPEWGCDADEPAIIVGMAEYLSDNASKLVYHGYWDQDTPVVTKLSENQFPLMAQAYIYHFGTPVEWTPASYFGADLYDWFDAQDTETITMDGSNLVSNWESKVGSGRSAAQGNSSNMPVYEATARNGFPGINSDGTSDYLVQTSVTGVPAGQAAFTWAVQAYGDPSLATGFKYFLSETVENTASTSSRALGSGNGSTRFQASGTLSTGQLHSNDRSIVCTAAAGATQAMKLSIDGLASATGSPAVGSFTVSRATLFAGGGASGTFGGYSDVILQEVIKVNREVTDDETDMLHGYLAHRWGRASALADTHPYKGNPPVILAENLAASNEWPSVPAYTPRTNVRWISTTGNDSNDGLTKATAWRTFKASSIPSDCEVIFADGTYTTSLAAIYSSWGGGAGTDTGVGDNITIRSETYQGCTLDGTTAAGGEPFTMFGGEINWEFWGLQFTGWRGVGQIIPGRDMNGLRVIGNKFYNNATSGITKHTFYISHGITRDTAPRNIVISHNDINEPGDVGCVIHSWDAVEGYFAVHDLTFQYNKVRGVFWNPFLFNANYGNPANITIANNDIRVSASQAVINFYQNDPENMEGVDATCVVEENVLENSNASGVVVLNNADAQHTPTFRDNVLYHSGGGSLYSNFSAGVGDTNVSPNWLRDVPTTITLGQKLIGNYAKRDGQGTGGFVTSAFIPPANSLLVVTVQATVDSGAADVSSSLTLTDSAGLTWTPRANIGNANSWAIISRVFTAPVGASPVSMTITADCGANNLYAVRVVPVAYMNYNVASPIGATVVEDSGPTDGPMSITLSGAPASSSIVLASLFQDNVGSAGNIVAGTGWTELVNVVPGGFSDTAHLQSRTNSQSTSVDWNDVFTVASEVYKNIAIALEIKAES